MKPNNEEGTSAGALFHFMNEIILRPIGTIRSPIHDPSRDENWGGVVSTIELDPSMLSEEATVGLDAFSHIQVIYHFDQVEADQVETGARHPKGRTSWPKVGILAQRAKRRPNRLVRVTAGTGAER